MESIVRKFAVLLLLVSMVALSVPFGVHAQEPTLRRLLVQFKPGRKEFVRQTLQQEKAQIHYEFDQLNTIVASLPADAVDRLRNNPGVLLIEEDLPRYPTEEVVPYGIEQIEARRVWDPQGSGQIDPSAPNGAGRLICVIDSGVKADHEDLSGLNFVGGYPSGWNTDTCGHGTHIVGTIAAAYNGFGVIGVSPGTVSLYIVKVYGNNCAWTYSSTLVDAAYRCRDAGAHVINMSLGGNHYSSFEDNAFRSLYQSGILLVAAAGNSGGTEYLYPASYDSVISVAAVDQNNVVANFSQKNNQVELAAPGVFIYSTVKSGGYAYMSGTSSATAHASAAAAVVWSGAPDKTNAEIRSALQQTALDLGAAGRDNAYGYGLIRTKTALELLGGAPTSVEVTRFEAQPDRTTIRIEWDTASELDTLGFHLYRAESADGPRTRLNDSLIPAQSPGSATGAAYQFVDASVVRGLIYYYWLEAVDRSGASQSNGPIRAELPALRRLLPARPRPTAQPLQLRSQ